jgi:tetratricopeptide (TPR) repeat protein
MRKHVWISCIFCWFLAAGAWAQASPVDVFQSTQPVVPESYGNGVIRHIIEADNLLRLGRFEEALIAYDNALIIDPYFAEGYIKRAVAKFRLGRTNEAERDYRQGLKINPYAGDLHGYKGATGRLRILAFDYQQPAENPEVEIDQPQRLAAADYQLLINQVMKLKNSGSVPAALQAVNQTIDQSRLKDPRLFKLRGNLYVLLNEFRKAIEDYDYAITLDNSYEEAYFNRGLANLLTNNRPDACSDMEKSVRLGYEEGAEKMMYFCGF